MYCEQCGNKISEGDTFCTSCGKSKTHNAGEAINSGVLLFKNSFKNKVIEFRNLIITLIVIFIIVVVAIVYNNHASAKIQAKNADIQIQKNNIQAVVNIACDNGKGGSGTIFNSDGTILTNNHVIEDSTVCFVSIPDPTTGKFKEIYEAAPVIVPTLSKQYDVATLKIDNSYTDSKGKTWGTYPTTFTPFILPSTCNSNVPSQLGDSLKIYGYPVTSGGSNLTITDGIISSFADDGNILTSAKVDSGNSGGLAVDQNGCWLGIPSAVISGNYQNLGVIIPGSVIYKNFLNNIQAKLDPATSDSDINSAQDISTQAVITPEETNDQICQNNFGEYSQWSGQKNSKGNPTCTCQTGYFWDGTGNACATKSSLEQACSGKFGLGAYPYTEKGKAVCGCSSGYQWNSDETACEIKPVSNVSGCDSTTSYSATTGLSCSGDGTCASGSIVDDGTGECVTLLQYCQNKNGADATYNSADNTCGCAAGYAFDADNICTIKKTGYQVCADMDATWDGYSYTSSGGFNCTCDTGYEVSSDGKSCIIAPIKTGYEVCSEDFPHETWDGTYDSNGKYNCVCDYGYTFDSNLQGCY